MNEKQKTVIPNDKITKNNIPNVPNLRFLEFDTQWKRTRLNDISQRVVRKNKNLETKLPLTISAQYGLIDQSEFFNKQIASKDLSGYYLLKNGEFVYNKSYSKDYPFGAIKRLDRYKSGALSSLYICFQLKDNVNSDFMSHYFETNKWNKEISDISGEGARNHGLLNMSVDDFFDTKHWAPSITEQSKIAKFLTLIDQRIEAQSKIIEDCVKLKNIISDILFSHSPLSENPLGTLYKKGKAGGTPKSTNKDYFNGGIPFLSIADMTEQGKYISTTEKELSEAGLKNSSAWIIRPKSLIMSMYASVGQIAINQISLCTSQAMFSMEIEDGSLLEYLYYFLSYFKQKKIHRYLETGTQSNINADLVKEIMIPNYGEENNIFIVSVLSTIDKKTQKEKDILELYKKQKAYLLQNLFI